MDRANQSHADAKNASFHARLWRTPKAVQRLMNSNANPSICKTKVYNYERLVSLRSAMASRQWSMSNMLWCRTLDRCG
jgi:hypothetical protein